MLFKAKFGREVNNFIRLAFSTYITHPVEAYHATTNLARVRVMVMVMVSC